MPFILPFYLLQSISFVYFQAGNRSVSQFVVDYLGNDGVFLLRILAGNTNDVVMAELMGKMWFRYLNYKNTAKNVEKHDKTQDSSVDIELEEIDLSAQGDSNSGHKPIVKESNPLLDEDKHHIA